MNEKWDPDQSQKYESAEDPPKQVDGQEDVNLRYVLAEIVAAISG